VSFANSSKSELFAKRAFYEQIHRSHGGHPPHSGKTHPARRMAAAGGSTVALPLAAVRGVPPLRRRIHNNLRWTAIKKDKTLGRCPKPRKLFEKSLIKNFNVRHWGKGMAHHPPVSSVFGLLGA